MADSGSQPMELLFFDTFTHELTEELNLDLVQFPCPVIIYEIRVIPLRTQVQADLPGGVRLGATNPSSFKLELFVNNLNKPNSSTFENIGVLQYKENNIQLKPNEDVPTDGLIIKGWYNAITLAVIGTLTSVAPKPERSSPPPPPPPTQPPRAKVESRPVEQIKPDHRPHPPPQQQHPLDYIQQQIQLQQVQQQQRFQQQSAAAGGHPIQPSPTITPPLLSHPHPPQPQTDFRHGDHRDPLSYPPRPGHDTRDRREPVDRSNFPPEPKEPYEQRDSHDERSRDSYDWEYRDRGRRSSRDSRERSQSRESSREPRDYRDSRDRDIDRERSSRDRDRDSRDRESDRDRGRDRDWDRERERDRERDIRERDHEREREIRERELRDREIRERENREARERELEREIRERELHEREIRDTRERELGRVPEADDRDGRPRTPPQPRLRSESPKRAISKSPGTQQPPEPRNKDEDVESGELEEELYESLSDENSPAVFQQPEAEVDNDLLDEDRASYDDISSEDDMIAAEVDELQGIELYDISEDPWNFITSSFNPLQSELIPLECYESPALCKFEVEKKASDILDISDRPTEAESILDLIKQFADAPHHDKWVESMESLPTLFDNGLTYLIIKEDNTAVVEKIIEWTMEGVDLDKAMKQPESAFKVRHLKMGIKLTGALTSFSPDFAKKLILKDIQHKLINLFVSPYMAFSVKLLIVQALDKTVRFIDGLNWFLGTHTNQIPNKQTCYQRVLEIMMGKQLVRTTVALSCFLKKIHVFEVLKNFSRTVTNIVNNSSTTEDSESVPKSDGTDIEMEQVMNSPVFTESELSNVVNCLDEIYKVLVLAPDLIGQTNRSLPTCPPFDKGGVMYDPYPGLFYMFDHCGLLNSLFVLISTPSILSQTPVHQCIENIVKELLHSQYGLLYLASNYDLTNNIIRSLVQININDENEENVEEGPGKNLGIEMIYNLQVIMLLDQLKSYHSKHDSSIIIDDTEPIMCLQTLYSMTFTSIGLEAVVNVLAMEDNLDALIPFVKAEDDKKKELRRSKSVCTAFATELLRVLIKNSTNIKMLEKYSSQLITLSEDEINTKLTEIQDWLAPCQKQSYGYEGLSSMINLLKHTSEEIQKQPMPLVTVLRLLHNLAIPSDTRFPDENPKELKYKYALIELYSADCLPILMTILQKMNDKMMRPWQQGLAQTCDQWNMILSITQPTINIVKATIQYLIESRGALFKDVTNIPVLLELHTVLCSAPVNSIYTAQVIKIQKNIVDIVLAYTQPVLNQADTEDVLSESLWTMTIKEIFKHTSKSPYCYMGGMLLLSELLPLPLPLQTKEPLSETEIQQTINVRKLWSAHLHPLTSQFIEMISNFLVSGCQPLQNIIRRVCWQMTDLSAPAAQMLIRCILDQFLDLGMKRASGDDKDTDIFKEEIVASTLYNKILGLLSWLVTQASAKSALIHILKSINKSDEKYKAFIPGILNQMNIVCDKTIHIQIQENILNIIMSVCDPEVTMVSNESTMTLPEQLANSLPDKEVLCPTLKALLEHIERPEHNFTSVMPCVRTLVSLTFYDYGFFYVKRCIDQNPTAINKLLHRLNNCFSKDNPDCLSTLSSTIDLLNILVYIDPEEGGVRTYTLSPTELQDILEWTTSEDHPLIELDKLLKNLDKDEVIDNLLETIGTILKVLNEPDVTDAPARSEILEVVLPEGQSLNSLYNQRSVYIVSNEGEEERLSPTAWLANPCNDELDAESDVVMTNVEEMCKRYCGDFNLEEELIKGVELAAGIIVIKPKRLKDLRRSQEGINIYSRGRGGARRPFVAPMRGRGIMHGLVSSGRPNDPFRSRPANTSRPPSMHVDDFIKMEKHQGPEGSPHSTPPPPRRIEEPFRGRGRGGFDRGRGSFSNRGRFFTPPSSYGRHDLGPPRSGGLMESRGRGRGRPFSRGSGDYRSNIDSNIRERFSPRGRAPHWAPHKAGDPDPRFSSSFRGRRDPPGRHVRSFTK
ncbi:hypothetical protein LOTGIDRAFT_234825 [Lottia gigantea]|uniref:Virilizer N-terminal domain-containing protein n=1 Tax=Lottia gigantea TaxID=225164 RepID=V4BFQ0_LOTGI|nr:hypothetical protein LOTGIDRAFT_234825 [Lottia gigantea]ESO87799.1 hypothetical protein LOTGIDRAFT_234825 [Lottia gigantea]